MSETTIQSRVTLWQQRWNLKQGQQQNLRGQRATAFFLLVRMQNITQVFRYSFILNPNVHLLLPIHPPTVPPPFAPPLLLWEVGATPHPQIFPAEDKQGSPVRGIGSKDIGNNNSCWRIHTKTKLHICITVIIRRFNCVCKDKHSLSIMWPTYNGFDNLDDFDWKHFHTKTSGMRLWHLYSK